MYHIPDWDHWDYAPLDDEPEPQVELSLRKQRIAVCEKCEHMTEYKFCNSCGCFLPVKTYFKIFACPKSKW